MQGILQERSDCTVFILRTWPLHLAVSRTVPLYYLQIRPQWQSPQQQTTTTWVLSNWSTNVIAALGSGTVLDMNAAVTVFVYYRPHVIRFAAAIEGLVPLQTHSVRSSSAAPIAGSNDNCG